MNLKVMAAATLAACATIPLATHAQPTPAPTSTGTGRYPAMHEELPSLPNHVVYRPANLAALGHTKLPVYVWGNGGCSADGTSSRNHLLEIASHGYLVIAAGTIPKQPAAPRPAPPAAGQNDAARPPAGPLPAATTTSLLSDAIDWAIAEDGRKGSPFARRIATNRIAVSGWSCGGLQALNVAPDPRVRTAVMMNTGFFAAGGSPITGIANDKATLAKLHTPVLYVLGGPTDIAYANGMDDFKRISAVPAAVINIPVGHTGTYFEANGGLAAQLVTSWLDWQLKGDKAAAQRFTGANCGYCSDNRFTLERKNFN